jgi:hypothetical protein
MRLQIPLIDLLIVFVTLAYKNHHDFNHGGLAGQKIAGLPGIFSGMSTVHPAHWVVSYSPTTLIIVEE